jgi:predicted O-methyltransferase YrrM
MNVKLELLVGAALVLAVASAAPAQTQQESTALDRQVKTYLEQARPKWNRGVNLWNVPYADGQVLYNLVVRQGAKRILEIGTSTGHSTIWLAWAASKTGGEVTTIEIDRARHAQALRNFRDAGVAHLIDARLGDAHDMVKILPGPWDFVFQDADKEWYLQYYLDLERKLSPGGCYTAHNVLRPTAREVTAFLDRVKANPGFRTTFEDGGSGEGISVSCRVAG